MIMTSKTRLGKRKLEIREVRKEKQTTASKKHDKKCFTATETATKDKVFAPKKPETKSDLLDNMELTKQLNDALLEEVKNNEDAIVILEGKEKKHLAVIKSLEERIEKLKREIFPKSNSELGTQTSVDACNSELHIPCTICIYVASCEEELNWHVEDEHDIKTDMYSFETDFPCEICGKWCRTQADLTYHLHKHELDRLPSEPKSLENESVKLSCNFCDLTFPTKKDLMIHKKEEHKENVSICWNYSAGYCELVDRDCWFLHMDTSKPGEIVCNICKKVFPNIDHSLKHKKMDHVTSVEDCKNERNNSCRYGAQNCWYRHNSNAKNEENNVNQEVIEKLFYMMEQFTERILNLENQTKLQ